MSWWWDPGRTGWPPRSTCAQAGRSVLVLEAADAIGGGTRTEELTLPGFAHDVCSAIHPLAAVSPFFAAAGLDRYGLELLQPERALVHPLDGGRAGVLHRSLAETISGLGADGRAWDRHLGWITRHWSALGSDTLAPLLRVPRHPFTMAAFGARGALPATWFGPRLRHRRGPGPVRGVLGPRLPAARSAVHDGDGADAHRVGPRGRLALGQGGLAVDRRRDGRQAARPRGHHRDRPPGALARRRAAVDRRAASTSPPARCSRSVGDELPAALPPADGSVPLRPRRVQGGLRPVRAGPVDQRRRPPGRLPAPGGTLEEIAAGEAEVAAGRHPARPFVLVGPAEHLRPDPGPRRAAHAVDLLPRPPRLGSRT